MPLSTGTYIPLLFSSVQKGPSRLARIKASPQSWLGARKQLSHGKIGSHRGRRPDIDMEKLSRLGRQNKESEKVARRRKSLVLKFGARNKVSSLSSVGLNGHAKSVRARQQAIPHRSVGCEKCAKHSKRALGVGEGKGVRRRSVGCFKRSAVGLVKSAKNYVALDSPRGIRRRAANPQSHTVDCRTWDGIKSRGCLAFKSAVDNRRHQECYLRLGAGAGRDVAGESGGRSTLSLAGDISKNHVVCDPGCGAAGILLSLGGRLAFKMEEDEGGDGSGQRQNYAALDLGREYVGKSFGAAAPRCKYVALGHLRTICTYGTASRAQGFHYQS
ncbi:hypothetical protein BDZ88DRAFT_490153 [Geranomyces variabilis]|nr:hypothetical protein BDZ88DRAFT_490153 [Geranomyces variabilis]